MIHFVPHVSVASLPLSEADTGGMSTVCRQQVHFIVLNVSVCMYVLIMYVYIQENNEQCASSPSLLLQDAVCVA